MKREELEEHLEKKGARIFKDIHVSGHGSREDLRDVIQKKHQKARNNKPSEAILQEDFTKT